MANEDTFLFASNFKMAAAAGAPPIHPDTLAFQCYQVKIRDCIDDEQEDLQSRFKRG